RMLHRLANVAVSGKVNNGLNIEAFERFHHEGAIGDITRNQRSPSHRPIVASPQIIEHDRRVAGCRKSLAGVAADVTGSAGDEDFQAHGWPVVRRSVTDRDAVFPNAEHASDTGAAQRALSRNSTPRPKQLIPLNPHRFWSIFWRWPRI